MLSLEVNREFDVEFGADISMDLDVDSKVNIKNTQVAPDALVRGAAGRPDRRQFPRLCPHRRVQKPDRIFLL